MPCYQNLEQESKLFSKKFCDKKRSTSSSSFQPLEDICYWQAKLNQIDWMGGWLAMCWGEGVIRWLSTNSTMVHLGSSGSSSSRHHEICVYSYPFIRLCRIFLWTKADGRSDSEWPDAWDSQNRGYKRLQETGGSMETTKENKMCLWTDAFKSPETRGGWGKTKYLDFIQLVSIWNYLHKRTTRLLVHIHICVFFFLVSAQYSPVSGASPCSEGRSPVVASVSVSNMVLLVINECR